MANTADDESNLILMEVTKKDLESGLRGVPVGYCTTSSVDPHQGLYYVGRPVDEIAHRDPEDVISLLINKRWPDTAGSIEIRKELHHRQKVDPGVFQGLKHLPKSGHPMKWFSAALNLLGMLECEGDYRKDMLNVIAQAPVVVAAIIRIREGWGEPIAPRDDLGYMENFVHMLGMPGATPDSEAKLIQLMRVFNVLHYDHGGGNLSTFTGKAVASGLADMYESLIGAMAGLAGPRHGKANQECLEFVQECCDAVGSNIQAAPVKLMIEKRLSDRKLVYGFGHAVLRVEDPRAAVLRKLGEELCPNERNFLMVKVLREVVPPILKTNPKISNPYPNVDLVSGTLLHAMGFNKPEYYTVFFGLARVVGISIQIVYERCEARVGKGVPIMRPKYIYSVTGTATGEPDLIVSG